MDGISTYCKMPVAGAGDPEPPEGPRVKGAYRYIHHVCAQLESNHHTSSLS